MQGWVLRRARGCAAQSLKYAMAPDQRREGRGHGYRSLCYTWTAV